ncbi:MAG: hypothetical protein PF482_14040 [Desulfobacteraceae bacterium]|jgi:hypothetical protein|nr:hypothetical protein [Desulfobacteraceae bacterium]
MSFRFRLLLLMLMSLALFFGYLNLFIPDTIPYNFDRLHIFLFNLCAGGSIILYFTEGRQKVSPKIIVFLIMAIIYAIFAFFEMYIPVLVIAMILMAIVESIRIKKFSFFPFDFFKSDVPVSAKFHQASLLCLSMGLMISSLVILNNEYFFILNNFPKLQLDTFFLGFSFPLSLITMSLLFNLMKDNGKPVLWMKNIGFWFVNLGVIIFFIFIIFEKMAPQVFVTLILFGTVVMILYLLVKLGKDLQQKAFLVSGMGFLLYTAITGILYIVYEMSPDYVTENYKWLMRMHSFASLYGWNLCGLAIICRFDDFPLKLHSYTLIGFHWFTVIFLAPMGMYYKFFSCSATICFFVILYAVMFTKGTADSIVSASK